MGVLPTARKESSLVLKGGTAINLSTWNMPRLSADIAFSRYP
ncbi:MAG: nucleotidyl transferase AbiEii/AbiGii toxin family protein [Bacteroidota bacterium]|nr:nucleotidyl transferase AbiEii/AbiGii toxin family protein [Bacteroidota bacterium]